VKIDGAYIKDLARNPRDAAIVRAIASLCEEIGVEVVAEMVETEEQAKLAARLGVELGQGFHFGKPKTDEDFTPPDANRPALNLRRKGFAETWQ
jgi:EAL domain-containing protein (putative c-di-GMP-specific phosphodiesterase class I)